MADDKPLPPSEKKLRDARQKGQVPKSREFVSGTVTLAALGYVVSCTDAAFAHFTQLIRLTGDLVNQPLAAAVPDLGAQLFAAASKIVVPMLALVTITAAMTSMVASGGLALSLSSLAPKPQKLNPAEGFKNLLSIRSLLDVLKSLVKLVLIAVIASNSIRSSLAPLVAIPSCGLSCAAPVIGSALRALISASAVVILLFGLLDLGIQRWLFMREQRMDHTEMKNEHKETEGNPEVRREHARERRASSQLRIGIHEATFVISGGKFAVAMRYSKVDTKVPIPVARAEAESVAGLLLQARQRNLPIAPDATTARRVFETIPLGQRITRELYEPVLLCMNALGML